MTKTTVKTVFCKDSAKYFTAQCKTLSNFLEEANKK